MPALEAKFDLVGRADKIERRGCGGRRDDVIARPEHGQERHRDVGQADWVPSKHDLAGRQPVVALQHLHGLLRRRVGNGMWSVAQPVMVRWPATYSSSQSRSNRLTSWVMLAHRRERAERLQHHLGRDVAVVTEHRLDVQVGRLERRAERS